MATLPTYDDHHTNLVPKGLFLDKPSRIITLDTDPRDGLEFIYKSRLEDALLIQKGVKSLPSKQDLLDQKTQAQNRSPSKEDSSHQPKKSMVTWGRKQATQFVLLAHKIKNNRLALMAKFPKVVKFPSLDEKDWCRFCLGSSVCAKVFGEDPSKPVVEGHQPLLSIVLHLKRKQLMQLICWHHKWFKAVMTDARVIDTICMWTYALCCNLNKPLDSGYEKRLEEIHDSYKDSLDSLDELSCDRVYLIVAILKYYYTVKSYADGPSWSAFNDTSYYRKSSSTSSYSDSD